MTDYHWTESLLEIRIPWLLLQARDPSNREFIGDLTKDGLEASVTVDEIYIGALQLDTSGNVIKSSMPMEGNHVPTLHSYSWDTWDLPQSKERLKKSYYILQKAFE